MIEDNEVKIAANPIEALWTRARDASKSRIHDMESTMIIERAFVKMCERELLKIKRNITEKGGADEKQDNKDLSEDS